MATRETLRSQDVRDLMRLLGDVRAVADVAEQGRVLVDGLARLIDADMGWYIEGTHASGAWQPAQFGIGTNRDADVLRFMQSWGQAYPLHFDLMAARILEDDRPTLVKQWDQVKRTAPTGEWMPFRNLIRSMDVVDIIDPVFSLRPGHQFGVTLQRRGRRRIFGRHESALMQLAADELRWLTSTGRLNLCVADRVLQPALPPRLQQVLAALLQGRAPKTIARETGLSLWTVREHIQRVYRHFGVSGREELTARFVAKADGASGWARGDGAPRA